MWRVIQGPELQRKEQRSNPERAARKCRVEGPELGEQLPPSSGRPAVCHTNTHLMVHSGALLYQVERFVAAGDPVCLPLLMALYKSVGTVPGMGA